MGGRNIWLESQQRGGTDRLVGGGVVGGKTTAGDATTLRRFQARGLYDFNRENERRDKLKTERRERMNQGTHTSSKTEGR